MNEQATMMNPQQKQQMMNANQNQMINMSQMNQPQQQVINRSYGMWAPPMQPQLQFQNPNANGLSGRKQPSLPFGKSSKPLGPRNNWKGKNVKNDKRRMEQQKVLMAGSSTGAPGGGISISGNLNFNNYNPPTVNELQHQNRLKTRKFFSKKKFNKNSMNTNMGNNKNNSRSAPFAPRNTSSYIIRAKKSGGIASLVSPCPVTPAVLPTPIFSPSREVFVDMAKEEWGVNGYGSMKGLIRLRSPGHELDGHEDEEEDDGGSSESDVEEHVEMERRLDHDLSRFEMIYNPNGINVGGMEYHNVLENRVDDQDTHIAQLEEENLILKERLFLMEREFAELRRRLQGLERRRGLGEREDINEELVENDSENESVSHGEETHSTEENNDDLGEENVVGDGDFNGKDVDNRGYVGIEAEAVHDQNVILDIEVKVENNDDGFIDADKNENIENANGKEDKNGDEFAEESKTEENIVSVEEEEENDIEKNNYVDEEVKVENNVIGASEHKTVGVNVCMEEVGHVEDKAISEKCLEN
ncbi:uncharacterized protein LOC111371387 isoform X2 [Olea europaea var. sylvestris]|uniref:PRLI-interacting factor A n=1 Tax=Olea europaea subsp. europaea TaxID=158383 RepID=A0A8S0UB23_OLEEU|nr:uncharacterized protein LOC111371387 isoform X2 [Olea europaea var. sylvestris]XP_022849103.1 uncharacterized protein LOC111371387 isoform X2 [Olea europaea var. sylvestris]CAA3013945.1 Hypothetical predicted protein [Olea europaea subsp. europaea]